MVVVSIFDIEADSISLETSFGSSIKASGKALIINTSSSSGSEINVKNLMSNLVIAKTTSGSKISVYPFL